MSNPRVLVRLLPFEALGVLVKVDPVHDVVPILHAVLDRTLDVPDAPPVRVLTLEVEIAGVPGVELFREVQVAVEMGATIRVSFLSDAESGDLYCVLDAL